MDSPGAPEGHAAAVRALAAAALTTAAVTAISYAAPRDYAGTAVGLGFLAATWWLVLRHDEPVIRAHGLSLGGLLEPAPLSPRRLAADSARALGWALLLCAIVFPAFWYGYRLWWSPRGAFTFRLPAEPLDEIVAQVLVVALPEEAFFRGYLQSALDRAFPPRLRVLGARIGLGLVISAAIFAVGHLLTIRHPARLAVFFPALLFGWLRARTGGIGAAALFHAACNLFSAALARGYGLAP